jgi:hypothetical protein
MLFYLGLGAWVNGWAVKDRRGFALIGADQEENKIYHERDAEHQKGGVCRNCCQRAKRCASGTFEAHFLQLRKSIGPPWGQDHKLAMALAIVAYQSR